MLKKRRALPFRNDSGSVQQSCNPNLPCLSLFSFFSYAVGQSISQPCDDCLSVLSDPEEDFQPFKPFTPCGLVLTTNPVLTFFSPISSPPKHSVMQFHRLRHQPHLYNLLEIPQVFSQTLIIPYQLDYSSQFLSPQIISLKLHKNFLHLFHFHLMFYPLFRAPTSSNSSLITLLGRPHQSEYYTNRERNIERYLFFNIYNTA